MECVDEPSLKDVEDFEGRIIRTGDQVTAGRMEGKAVDLCRMIWKDTTI